MSRDTVAFTVFPDEDEDAARGALRRNLSELFAALPDGRQLIDADSERIGWRTETPVHVDVIAFEEAVRDGRDADAIAEYGGALLPTIYDEWATTDRERLRVAFHDALNRTISLERSHRRYDVASATAYRLLDEDPWREDIVRQLMTIRYEAGDRAGALAAFERFATLLRTEMQTEPMPETFALRDALLRGALLPTSEPQRPLAAPTLEAAPNLPFVGREGAMERAHRAWQGAAAGRASVLFVSGEAGVGKSKFTTELVRIAEREGGFILRGYTSPGGELRPYEAIAEAMLASAAPFDEKSGPALTDDRAARLRFFETIRLRLSDLSRRRPIVLVLEDMHWAGESTIDLLALISRRLDNAPVLIVATSRSDELPRAHPLRALRRQLQGQGLAVEISLDRLTREDATRAARAVLRGPVDEADLARVLAWVDGVPLLLVEAMRDVTAGRPSSASSMTALVSERFARLSPAAETALTFGAVVGERFDVEALAAAMGWRENEVLDAIGEAIEHGFVRAASRTAGLLFAFTHDLVRVAATERIPPAVLTRTHGLVARALITQFPGSDERAGEIARHFAVAGETLRAAEYFRSAARYALTVFANEDARAAASAGLELCDATDPTQRTLRYELTDLRERSLARIGATAERRTDAHLLVDLAEGDDGIAVALGRLFQAYLSDESGRQAALSRLEALAGTSLLAKRTYLNAAARHAILVGEFARAREATMRAAELCEADGDISAAMRARFIGIGCLGRLGAFAQGQAEMEQFRPIVDASEDLVLRFEFHLMASSILAQTDREKATADGQCALDIALRIGDRTGEARARQNIAANAGKLGRYDQALEENERALEAYRELGDEPAVRDAVLNVIAMRIWCGDFARAQSMIDDLDEASTPHMTYRYHLLRGMVARGMERRSEAEASFLKARRRADDLGASFDRARADFELGLLMTEHDRFDDAGVYLDAALEAFSTMGQPEIEIEALALSARILASTGNRAGAQAQAQSAIARCDGKRPQAYSQIAWNVAVAFDVLGDRDQAKALAGQAAVAAVDDAVGMPAELSETFLQLPWHRQTIAYLWGTVRNTR